jgi:hypothetical protein
VSLRCSTSSLALTDAPVSRGDVRFPQLNIRFRHACGLP